MFLFFLFWKGWWWKAGILTHFAGGCSVDGALGNSISRDYPFFRAQLSPEHIFSAHLYSNNETAEFQSKGGNSFPSHAAVNRRVHWAAQRPVRRAPDLFCLFVRLFCSPLRKVKKQWGAAVSQTPVWRWEVRVGRDRSREGWGGGSTEYRECIRTQRFIVLIVN